MGQKDYTVKPGERQTLQAVVALQMINIEYNHHLSVVMPSSMPHLKRLGDP
jgi:hypothetical protein